MDGGDVASSSLEADMEEDLITAAFGPMGRLLRRLHSFQASSGHRLPEGISADEIRFLTEGLEGLYNHLKGLPEADLGASFTPKWWIKEVRELAYDTEDYLDEVSQSGAGDGVVVRRSVRLSTISRITSSKRKQSRPQIAQGFLELMARVDDARERCKSFHLAPETATEPNSRQASVSRHTPVSAASISDVHVVVDNGSQTVVGFEEPMKNLVNLLAFGDINQKQLKAVAILGLPGVGKTMVARILYHRYGGEFQCRAFIRVSRNPDMRRILTSILTQIKAPSAHAFSDAQDLIGSIIKHLQGKRYFIIVDDLWTASVWNIISRAFPNGDCCSRILTTTQIEDVALACSDYESEYIYKMGPLNDGESRNLFFSSVFGFKGEGGCPKEFQVVADEIIRKCGGLPLSTVNVASLLVQSKRNLVMEQWEKVERSLPSNLRTNPTSQGMKDVLILIYNKLPLHLKTCLLYFGMYPEGHTIRKDDLVKQWAAESFVRDTEKGYFDELVRRGLVQPVDTNYNGEVLSCTVNHMVLDLIRYKSMEDNFITTINYTESTLGLPDKVRRLSVQFGGAKCAKVPESIRMSHVRSLLFCGFSKCVPSIPDYGLLQVLILYIWPDQDETDFDLPIIGELFRLRYLKVECNTTINLPDKIQGLRYLETLQLDARLFSVPSDIGHLETLQHLRLPSQADVRDLGRLTNLQDLHLTVCTVQPADSLEDNMKYLGVILEKLSNLKSVTLAFAGSYPVDTSIRSILCDSLSNVSAAPAHLERLELLPQICIFPSLPRWFETLSKLCVLKIAVKELSNSDIDILKGLPALTALSLYIQTAPADRIVFGKAGFSALKYFKLRCSKPLLKFEADAMPNLRTLKLVFNAQEVHQHGAAPICIEHLAGLKEIFAKIKGAGADGPESALWVPVSNDPTNPKINEQPLNWSFFADEDTSMPTQEQEDRIIEEEGEVLEENTDGVTQCAYKEEDGNSRPDNVVSSTSLESSPATSRRPLGREYGMTIFSTRVKAILKARPWLTSKATSEGRDGLLWWHDLLPCYAGEFSVATVQANNLLEDQFRIESSAPLGTFIGVFDGHGGPEAARFAADHLFPNLQEAFGGLGMTTKTIEKAFQGTEESFIELVSRLWMTKPTLAAVGSCCLVSIVHQRTLFVASLGDSRAVLGKVLEGKIFPEQLSSEHLVCHESIRKEIKAQHPNDPQIVMLTHNVWRVKGIIQLSRSIGDAYLKDQKFNREPLPASFRVCEPFNKPILSASPSIVSRDLQRTDRFIIFASDGLWEHLSNEEAVKIVHSCPCAGIARSLIKAALREAARKRAMRYSDLKKIERGIRRHFHDDITVVVLFIDYDLLGENHAQERSLSIGSTLENPSLKK